MILKKKGVVVSTGLCRGNLYLKGCSMALAEKGSFPIRQ
jgi:hypothetical protein